MRRFIILFLVAVPVLAQAVPANDVSQIIDQFQAATLSWLTTGENVASGLFGILAAIEFGITLGMLSLRQADITIWGATLVRKFMTVGAFYALLLLGPSLMQAIIDSYVKFGSMASEVPSITASNILGDGIEIAANLLIAAVAAGASLSVLTAALVLLCAVVIVWSFIKLMKGFVMAKIESFITIYAAVIQLGGRFQVHLDLRGTVCCRAMATGVKLMVFYFIVGVERALAPSWIAAAKQSPTAFAGFIPTLTLTASIVLFCALAEPEKLAANIFGGQPQFTGHDVTNSYIPYVAAGVSIATSPALISSITGSTAAGGVVGAVDNAFHGSSGPGRAGQALITLAAGSSGGNAHPTIQSAATTTGRATADAIDATAEETMNLLLAALLGRAFGNMVGFIIAGSRRRRRPHGHRITAPAFRRRRFSAIEIAHWITRRTPAAGCVRP